MRIRSLLFAATVFAAGVIAMPQVASAQVSCSTSPSCFVDHTINLVVPAVLRLTIGSASTAINPTAAQVIAGSSASVAGPSINVVSNRIFSLDVQTTTATWSGPVGTSKAAADLGFAFNGGASAGLGTSVTNLVTGGARGVQNYTSAFQVVLNPATDFDGAYSIVARFTATAP